MHRQEYEKARKSGLKVAKAAMNRGEYPYLPVLDDITEQVEIIKEENLGVIDIPLDQIVGTKTQGRTNAFARNFMPLLEEASEFATKWMNLYKAQISEGIRDPIEVYEYLNHFYVMEGNKRVSIMKYVGANSIRGRVTRMIPKQDGSKEIAIYHEFLYFYQITKINNLIFTEKGGYETLLKHVGVKEEWDDELRKDVLSCYERFAKTFEANRTRMMRLTTADAFVVYLDYYGYDTMLKTPMKTLKSEIKSLEDVYISFPKKKSLQLRMDKEAVDDKPGILTGLQLPGSVLKVGFFFDKTAETSRWTYNHELGMKAVEKSFGDKIRCYAYYDLGDTASGMEAMEDAVAKGCTLMFATTPKLVSACTAIAVKYPNIKILNCSLNTLFGHVKTYYARQYEAKFLMGVIAGLVAENDRIGYLADYPIYGAIANINAFALGVSMVNTRAKIYLHWYTRKEENVDQALLAQDISIVSGYDSMIPNSDGMRFGLFDFKSEDPKPIAMAVWNWEAFYEKMIRSVLNNNWNRDKIKKGEAINYWWGMNAGVIDFLTSSKVPTGNRNLAEALKKGIAGRNIYPFSNEIYAQGHIKKLDDGEVMDPYDIMNMDWLLENVVGSIPSKDELVEGAKKIVELQGIKKEDRNRL
ncbi:MAG: BMP family ABC transporter substrate-binding protein [Lachnospiraceae bacterium]|nr:BMP family ABC transporter substrate-binding protein [Lachnospiraceae bacterium]